MENNNDGARGGNDEKMKNLDISEKEGRVRINFSEPTSPPLPHQ